MSSVFDPASLLDMQVTGANDTKLVQVAPGEYTALVKDVKPRSVNSRDGEQRVVLDVTWTIDDEGQRTATGLREPSVRQGIFLDMLAGGGLDMGRGKNVGLGKLRAALGMNDPSQPFSFRGMIGRPARVQISSRTDDKGDIYADVKSVAPLAA